MDSQGRLFVGDRQNNRIQIFDQDGKFLDQWAQFSRPSGIFIDRNDNIYVADSESESVSKNHDGWKRASVLAAGEKAWMPAKSAGMTAEIAASYVGNALAFGGRLGLQLSYSFSQEQPCLSGGDKLFRMPLVAAGLCQLFFRLLPAGGGREHQILKA